MAIIIDQKLCVGCQACLKACPYDAIDLINRKAYLNDNCVHCGACVPSCKFNAILSHDGDAPSKDLSVYCGVLVFAETRGHGLDKVALELLGVGRSLADARKAPLLAVVIGHEVESLAQPLIHAGADRVYLVQGKEYGAFRTAPFARALTGAIQEIKPEIVLVGATTTGRDLAPRVANRLKTGLTADCTELKIEPDSGLLLQTRPAFGGNVMATIVCPNHRPQMSTVRPGVMKPIPTDPNRTGEVHQLQIQLKPQDLLVTVREILHETRRRVDLGQAEVIVSGGRGVGGPQGFQMLQTLAETLRGEVGASRAAVDSGWIDHDHQVGQTGRSVAPKLYFACGISGAIQHLAGISGADFVVAVNRDPEAPIMKRADVAVVGDVHEIIPLLTQQIAAIQRESER